MPQKRIFWTKGNQIWIVLRQFICEAQNGTTNQKIGRFSEPALSGNANAALPLCRISSRLFRTKGFEMSAIFS